MQANVRREAVQLVRQAVSAGRYTFVQVNRCAEREGPVDGAGTGGDIARLNLPSNRFTTVSVAIVASQIPGFVSFQFLVGMIADWSLTRPDRLPCFHFTRDTPASAFVIRPPSRSPRFACVRQLTHKAATGDIGLRFPVISLVRLDVEWEN